MEETAEEETAATALDVYPPPEEIEAVDDCIAPVDTEGICDIDIGNG